MAARQPDINRTDLQQHDLSIFLRPPMTRDAAGTLLGQTIGLVAVTAGLFAVGAYFGRNLAYQWGWLLFIAAFACLIAMNAAAQRRGRRLRDAPRPLGARPHPLLGPDRAHPVRHRYYLRRHPERCADLCGPRPGGFRGLDGVRLPAPSPQPRHPGPLRCSRPRSSWTSSTCSFCCCRSSAAATTSWRSRGSHAPSAPADRAVPSALEAV